MELKAASLMLNVPNYGVLQHWQTKNGSGKCFINQKCTQTHRINMRNAFN